MFLRAVSLNVLTRDFQARFNVTQLNPEKLANGWDVTIYPFIEIHAPTQEVKAGIWAIFLMKMR